MSEFDLVVIGGGPAGYVSSIRAAQLGMKVACVEERGALGGTCLNVGCIPSKALLQSSELYEEAKDHFAGHGIKTGNLKFDIKTMMKRKNEVVNGFTQGIEGLLKKNKISYYKGHGIVMGKGSVAVKPSGKGSAETLKTKNILIATGSEVMQLPGIKVDEKKIVSSTGALTLSKVPKKMIVIGGGVIGLELGSVWRRLGTEVTVIEFLDRITPGLDGEISKQFQKILEKQGIVFKLSMKVTEAKATDKGVTLKAEPAAGKAEPGAVSGKAESLKADVVLVCIGRKPNTNGLGLQESGVEMDDRGCIKVDGHFKTSLDGIYAVGDVIAGPMLAHKAEEEGVIAVEMMAGQSGHLDYNLVPGVVYTSPEVATVGKTEEQLKEEGREYAVGKFPFMANSRARVMGSAEGFVKILADKKTDEVLGVHIIGPHAGALIAEAVIAMEFKASAEDIARTCHSHPDLGEAIKEAALAVDKRPIHI